MGDRSRQEKQSVGKRVRIFKAALAVLAAGVILGLGEVSSLAETLTVNCTLGETISDALGNAVAGDTLLVSGTCTESVYITRQMRKITLDGQGGATIQGPDPSVVPAGPSAFTVFIEGTDITVKNFTILGGFHGIHLSGPATALIDGNTIRETGGGIHLDKASIGLIVNNTIEDNYGMGIHLQEMSYARIGMRIPPLPDAMPNIIQNNQGHGISIDRWSSAWIVGNTIADNQGHGVLVDRNSQADVVGNAIEGNTGDGIHARYNAGVNLSSEGSDLSEVLDQPNTTEKGAENGGFGIYCEVDGYVVGPQGTLAGDSGRNRFRAACTDRVTKK